MSGWRARETMSVTGSDVPLKIFIAILPTLVRPSLLFWLCPFLNGFPQLVKVGDHSTIPPVLTREDTESRAVWHSAFFMQLWGHKRIHKLRHPTNLCQKFQDILCIWSPRYAYLFPRCAKCIVLRLPMVLVLVDPHFCIQKQYIHSCFSYLLATKFWAIIQSPSVPQQKTLWYITSSSFISLNRYFIKQWEQKN